MRVEGGEGRKKRGGRTRRKGRKRLGRTGDMSVCRLSEVRLLGMLIARKQVRNPVISVSSPFSLSPSHRIHAHLNPFDLDLAYLPHPCRVLALLLHLTPSLPQPVLMY
jgi:hypothetical protein